VPFQLAPCALSATPQSRNSWPLIRRSPFLPLSSGPAHSANSAIICRSGAKVGEVEPLAALWALTSELLLFQ
jgi:hypothetical protein